MLDTIPIGEKSIQLRKRRRTGIFSRASRSIVAWTLIISLFFFLSLRVCFSSIMPAWSGVTANLVHFVLGILVLFDQFGRGNNQIVIQWDIHVL
jgi:hypothetical protein